MSNTRRIIVISTPNRYPTPIGSGVSSSTRNMRVLEVRLVTLIGDVVEHLLDRPPDHDLTLNPRRAGGEEGVRLPL